MPESCWCGPQPGHNSPPGLRSFSASKSDGDAEERRRALHQRSSLAGLIFGSETHYGAKRKPRAVRRSAGIVQPDIVELRPERQMRQHSQIHAATQTVGQVVGRCGDTGTTRSQVGASNQKLNERSDATRIVDGNSGAEQEGVGVQRDAARRGVIPAKITDDSKKAVRLEFQ